MFLDICKRHGLELDEEPSYDGRKYLETTIEANAVLIVLSGREDY